MNKFLLTFILSFVFCFSQGQSAATDPQLAKVENQFFLALQSKNFTDLGNFYDDSFQGVLSTGAKVDKAAMVEYQKTVDAHIAKNFEDLSVKIIGDIALSTGTEVNTAKTGTKLGQLRYLRVFLKKNNTWKIIGCHYTGVIQTN